MGADDYLNVKPSVRSCRHASRHYPAQVMREELPVAAPNTLQQGDIYLDDRGQRVG